MEGTPSEPGVIPSAFKQVFDYVQRVSAGGATVAGATSSATAGATAGAGVGASVEAPGAAGPSTQILVRCTYCELYNEAIRDLLSEEVR